MRDEPRSDETRPVVVYDGTCAFCRKRVAAIARRDTNGVFEYVPRGEEGLEDRFPRLAESDFDTGMRLVHPDGSISVGADAVYEMTRRLPRLRRLAWLYRVPGLHAVLRAAYAWVARNRHKLASRCDESCRVEPHRSAALDDRAAADR